MPKLGKGMRLVILVWVVIYLQQGGNNAAVASKLLALVMIKPPLLMQASPVYHAIGIGKDFISNNINVDPELVAAGKSAANVVGNKWQQFKEQNPVAAQKIFLPLAKLAWLALMLAQLPQQRIGQSDTRVLKSSGSCSRKCWKTII